MTHRSVTGALLGAWLALAIVAGVALHWAGWIAAAGAVAAWIAAVRRENAFLDWLQPNLELARPIAELLERGDVLRLVIIFDSDEDAEPGTYHAEFVEVTVADPEATP